MQGLKKCKKCATLCKGCMRDVRVIHCGVKDGPLVCHPSPWVVNKRLCTVENKNL